MNPEPLLTAPAVIQVHTFAALGALVIGAMLFVLPRGRRLHQALGLTCAGLLVVTAGTALFITGANAPYWSWIHGFIPLVLFGLFGVGMGLRRRDFVAHRWSARGLILGALLIPGLFTLVPGRIMHAVAFG